MEIKKNSNLDSITVLPNGGGTSDVFINIENHPDFAYISLNTTESRQVADAILKICDDLDDRIKK